MGGLARRFVQRLPGPPHELMDTDGHYVIPIGWTISLFHFTLAGDISLIIPLFFAVTVSTSINYHYPSEVYSIIENLSAPRPLRPRCGHTRSLIYLYSYL